MQNTKYNSLNIQIRNTLLDIVDYTYKGTVSEQLMERYKKFYLKASPKQVKSFAGQYNPKDRTILLVGLERDAKHIVVTTIHELTHHIDYCNRGNSDHSDIFYAEYEKLLHTALNLKVFEPSDITNIEDVSDRNKIRKMVARWTPAYISYKNGQKIIKVYNCYEQKELLKARGYHWQGVDSSWEKHLQEEYLMEELSYLLEIVKEEQISITDANNLSVNITGYIIAGKGSFENKEKLKEEGFYYVKEKKLWKKKVTGNIHEKMTDYHKKYTDIVFTIEM